MRFFVPFRPLLKGWLISFLAFGLLAFVFVGQFAWLFSAPFTKVLLVGGIRDWLPWALLAPLLFRLVSRLPLGRSHWKTALPVHLACAAATMLFCVWWADFAMNAFRDKSGAPFSEFRGLRPSATDNAPAGSPPRPSLPFGLPRHLAILFFTLGVRLPIYLTLISIAHAVHFYRHSQERERRTLELTASLAQSRLEALKMQLQPHFLFNTLNAIAALVHRDAEAADEMLSALSDLLRLTLESAGHQELPLSRELEFVERYLAIEHVRFGDRLCYELQIAEETRDALVPALLLQPLVENAVRHGLEPRPGPGLLTICSAREGGKLRLNVADNGQGLSEVRPVREGIGLSNTRARLHELYGSAATLEIRNSDGLRVEITLPFHPAA